MYLLYRYIMIVTHFINIECKIIKYIHKWDTCLVCSCWMSSEKIIDELSTLSHSECILTYQDTYNPNSCKYNKNLTALLNNSFCNIYLYKGDGLMHNKFMIFINDNIPRAVITGSYNFTENAKNNFENIIYIEDTEIAKKYYEEYCQIRNKSIVYK